MPPSSSLSLCSETRVTQFIRQYVASCLLVSDSNTELSYILPSEAVRKGCFERLFQVNTPTLKLHSSLNEEYWANTELTVSCLLPGSGAEFGQSGSHQLWCDGHNTGGGLSKSVGGRSVTWEQWRRWERGWKDVTDTMNAPTSFKGAPVHKHIHAKIKDKLASPNVHIKHQNG